MEHKKISKFLFIFLIGFSILGTVYLLIRPGGGIRYQTQAGQNRQVLLFISPAVVKIGQGEEFELELKIDTREQAAGGVEAEIYYNDQNLSLAPDLTIGPVFPGLKIESESGLIKLIGSSEVIGQGNVIKMRFIALKSGKANVALSSKSVVWDEGKNNNILQQVLGAEIIVD